MLKTSLIIIDKIISLFIIAKVILGFFGEVVLKGHSIVVMPSTQKILEQMGEQIKLARLRRKLSAELVAERAGVSRVTLWNIEKGSPSVAMGAYAAVLHAIGGMDRDLLLIAKDDELGRKLQDLGLLPKKRAPKKEAE
ncbi:helix-turn-helix domain-containing protein [bacterium]|nr:helix-turn-helix domain-containing protein [bacterium]